MTNHTLTVTEADQAIRIKRVGGSLKVEGWERQEIEATGDAVELGREDEAISLSSGGDVQVKAPRRLAFHVDFVGGGIEMQDLSGPVEISFVGSDVHLRNLTGQVTFRGLVGGSTKLENVSQVLTSSGGVGPFGAVAGGAWRKVEKAAGRADEQRQRLEKKIQNAERKLNRIRMGMEFDGARWRGRHWTRYAQTAEPAHPVSDEERTTILRMLQEKKITAEEADRLLGALEGEA